MTAPVCSEESNRVRQTIDYEGRERVGSIQRNILPCSMAAPLSKPRACNLRTGTTSSTVMACQAEISPTRLAIEAPSICVLEQPILRRFGLQFDGVRA